KGMAVSYLHQWAMTARTATNARTVNCGMMDRSTDPFHTNRIRNQLCGGLTITLHSDASQNQLVDFENLEQWWPGTIRPEWVMGVGRRRLRMRCLKGKRLPAWL